MCNVTRGCGLKANIALSLALCYISLSPCAMFPVVHSQQYFKYQLKYRCECTTGNIAQGRGREANIARGEAECYICLETTPACNISCSAQAKWYFNWFIATYTEQYFRYYIFQGKVCATENKAQFGAFTCMASYNNFNQYNNTYKTKKHQKC